MPKEKLGSSMEPSKRNVTIGPRRKRGAPPGRTAKVARVRMKPKERDATS